MDTIEKLPIELKKLIFSYIGIYKLRNGVYMKQIEKNDLRYNLLDKIPKPKINITNNSTIIYIELHEKNKVYDDGWYLPILLPIRSIKITYIRNFDRIIYQYSNLLHDNLLENKDCLTYIVE